MGRKEQEVQDTCVICGGRQGQGWERWPGLKPAGRVGASGLCARVHMHVCARVNGTEVTLPAQVLHKGSSGKEAQS